VKVKWQSILRHLVQDYAMPGFGAWIIWSQVASASPNGYLALIGFAVMFPAARSAIATILSSPGQPSALPPPQEEQQSQLPSQAEGSDDE
jgi:hypothetical protein